MTHHEETWLNANRNPNPKGGIYKTPIVPSTLLTTTYNALFESHTRYGCQIWGKPETKT